MPETDTIPEIHSNDLKPAVAEMSASELRLEREHISLEMERLSLERDKLETERLRLERERTLYGGNTNALHIGMGVFALAIAVVLVLGLLFGYNAGLDSGRQQAPAPRKVLVNGAFLQMLRQTPSASSAFAVPADSASSGRPPLPWVTLYARPASAAAYGNLPLVR